MGFGRRFWFRATGMPGWMRARLGLPAWGSGGCWFFAPYYWGVAPSLSKEEELSFLKEQQRTLSSWLKDLQKRIEELEKGKGSEGSEQ